MSMLLKFCTVLAFITLTLSARAQQPDSIKEKSSNIPERYQGLHKRSPILALAMSLYIPGSGQFYNREYVKAGVVLGGIGIVGIGAITVSNHQSANIHYVDAPGAAFIVLMACFYTYGVIDAPISAALINNKYNLPGHNQKSFSSIQLAPVLINTNYAYNRPTIGFKLTLR